MTSLSRCDHRLLSSLCESEVVDGVSGPVAAQQVTHHVQVTTLSGVHKRRCFRLVDL